MRRAHSFEMGWTDCYCTVCGLDATEVGDRWCSGLSGVEGEPLELIDEALLARIDAHARDRGQSAHAFIERALQREVDWIEGNARAVERDTAGEPLIVRVGVEGT